MPSDLELHQQLDRSLPVAPVGLIVLPSAEKLGRKVNDFIRTFRGKGVTISHNHALMEGYYQEDYRIPINLDRFETGEGRAVIEASVRGKDIYILVDITNYSITYTMNGFINHMSPDDHFMDLKRVISAIQGAAKRITVIMPFLYEGRQHHKSGRESMDAALMLKELFDLGINNFITFDAHDPRIQSVVPICDFTNYATPYQFLHALLDSFDDLIIDREHVVVISPDEGALNRTVYFADVIGADTGMFYIIDDMISSGGSMLDTSRQIKEEMHANRVFVCTTFGLFTDGLDIFDAAYEKGWFDKIVTTNLTYQPEELFDKPYHASADMSKYMATIIDFMNHDLSLTNMSTSTEKIHEILEKVNRKEQTEYEQRRLNETEF